jgi:hypothetical protein
VRVDKVERVLYDMLCVVWVGRIYTYDLPPYEHRCALLSIETLVKRCSIACIMFIFNILSGGINSLNLSSALDLNIPRYRTQGSEFL